MLLLSLALPYLSLGQSAVSPDSLGAMGDGETWDHDALQDAIDIAGDGGTVMLTHGKTYVICSEVFLKTGRMLIGNGATLKRCNSLLTSLTAAAFQNDTSVDVAHPEWFEIGQTIAVFTGPTHDEGEAKSLPVILDIAGSTLSLSDGLTADYPAGSGVIVVDDMMSAAGENVVVKGVLFDGNRRNNNEWVAWERGASLVTTGSAITVTGNSFVDCWSNCLKPFSTDQLTVTGNVFDSAAAAAIHISTTDSMLFEGNHIVDTNYNPGAEHSEAAITWSALNKNITVRDNCINRSETAAFGTINRRHNMNITIEDNLVCDSNGFFRVRMQTEPDPGFEEYGRLVVRNNVGVNVGASLAIHGGPPLPPIGNLQFEGNEIVNGYLEFDGLDEAAIQDNVIQMLDFATYGPSDPVFADRAGLLTLIKPRHTTVRTNTLIGGEKGMYFLSDDGTAVDSLVVEENTVLNSDRAGIVTAKVNWLTGNSDFRSDNSRIRLESNIVSTQLLGLAGDAGLMTTRGITVEDNCVETNRVGAEVSGTDTTLATGIPTTFYVNNTFAGSTGAISFDSDVYVSDILFDTNLVSSPIPLAFVEAAGTHLEGNVIDDSATCEVPPAPPVPSCVMCETDMPALDGVFLDATIMLEGAYAGSDSMTISSTYLSAMQDSGWTQPYGSQTYAGTELEHIGVEFIRPSLPPGMIDWVVVALRSAPGGGTEFARIAGILMKDGSIRSLDATPELFFPGVSDGSYFVVVYHRNHLPVMSGSAVSFVSGHGGWDFTTSIGQAFSQGGNPMKDLGGGVFGLFAGDLNADGMVTAPDFNLWLSSTKSALGGYVHQDTNLDGQVTAADFNFWLSNTKAGASTQVP